MRRTWLIFSQAVTVAVAMLFVVATLKPEWLARSPTRVLPEIVTITAAPPASPATAAAGAAAVPTLREAAQRAVPAVVSVAARKPPARNPHADDPWFRHFFGEGSRNGDEPVQSGLGSGVIVSPEGYVVTNHHVIDGAEDIEVQTTDGRTANARLVGTDPESDIAVLKIDLDSLPAIVFGDPAQVQVGDPVLAIGNPFNVGQTVTSGIVSALGRNQASINTFANFIQTDAAINPGNSGGALVNQRGELVGINTAIYSRSGGSMGIGFAIPVDLARGVLEQLIRDGQVTRGWIGVSPRDLTREMAQSFGLPVSSGVLIAGVLQGGPADRGGLKPGDVVTRVDGRTVDNTAQLLSAVAGLKPKTVAVLGVQRRDQAVEVSVTVDRRPPPTPREP